MKAKHLLFSSIFLSMGFAACTNEVEDFAPQTQDKDFPGVELGEDFAISVTNADFSADAATRAAFEKVGTTWIASWQENDAIGAAWFNKFVYGNNGKVSDSKDVKKSLGEYGSNAEFVWQGGTTFESEAISKLGAYVLYYPYNEAITDNMTEIPVVGIPATQPFDVQNPTAQVTANMTAANVAVFGKSGNQAPEFTVKQIPNLYALSFYIKDEALLELDQPVKITHVMLEADNHTAVFNTNGTIAPSYTDITPNTYNGVTGAPAMPVIDFSGATEKSDRIIIEVANEGKNSDYYIRNTGKENGTAKFYFSLLPTEELTTDVTFKIIGKVGKATKVFTKTVSLTSEHLAAETGFGWKMSQKGQVVNLSVELTNVSTEKGIYSVDQFVENWAAGDTEFDLAVPMDLTTLTAAQKKKVDFILPTDKHVVFKGEKVTLPAVSGKYTFLNDVDIKGDANLEVCSGCDAESHFVFAGKEANIIGNLNITGEKVANLTGNITVEKDVRFEGVSKATVYGKLTAGNVTLKSPTWMQGGADIKNVIVDAAFTAEKKSIKTGDITANAQVTVEKNATTGDITANALVKFNGEATTGAITANKDVTFKVAKKIAALTVNDGANVTATSAVVEGDLTINKGVVTIPTLEVANATVELEGELYATKFDAKGTVNANGLIDAKGGKINILNITPNITVNLQGAEIATLNNKKTASYSGTLNITNGTIKDATNNGTINGDYTVTGTFNQNAVADGNVITVAKDATFNVNADTKADITNNGTVTVAGGKTLTDNSAIVNNATMEVNGTLTESASVTLAEKSLVVVDANGNVTLTGAAQPGEVKVRNGSTLVYASKPAKVSYDWNGDAPKASIVSQINWYNVFAASVAENSFNEGSTVNLTGNIAFQQDVDYSAAGKKVTIQVTENSSFSSANNRVVKLNDDNTVAAGKVLTVSEKITLSGGKITVQPGGSVSGTADASSTDIVIKK